MPTKIMPLRRTAVAIAALAALLLAIAPSTARHAAATAPLVADLSERVIRITTGFTGAELLLFGVTQPGREVIVIVRGPPKPVVVRKKERVAGLWIDTQRVEYEAVPTFYRVAASGDLDEEAIGDLLDQHAIGVEYLNLSPRVPDPDTEVVAEFTQGLIRNKEHAGLYSTHVGKIDILGEQLFRTTVSFPANVPTGNYQVEVHAVEDGWVAHSTTTPLVVEKAGFEAAVFDFAHERPALYGLVAVVLALVAGWSAGVLFRKI